MLVPPMLPRNFLQGLSSNPSDTSASDAEAAASIYARAAGALASQASLAGFAGSAASPSSALLESVLAQEQRRQSLLASQLSAFNGNAAAADTLGALLLQREGLLGVGAGAGGLGALEQSILARAAAGGNLASVAALPSSLGLAGLGGLNSSLARGLANSGSPVLSGTAPAQLASLRDTASLVPDQLTPLLESSERGGRKGRTGTFPQKLHLMLSDLENEEGGRDIASWLPHGRAFAIHKPKEFVKTIMPKYFRMSRFSSFQRQLNLYEFQRITEGPDKGAYFHELFLHGRPMLCTQIKRNKIKGTQGRPTNSQNTPLGPAFGVFPIPSSSKASAPSPAEGP